MSAAPSVEYLGAIPDFHRQQSQRCEAVGIDVTSLVVSHVAIRVRTWLEYRELRDALEEVSSGNLENVWNGRPISKLMLAEPIEVGGHATVPLIELIPPFHQRVYKMGLEHIGYVVGPTVDEFAIRHRDVLTGQQFQSAACAPYYILFEDYTHVKFYRHALGDVCAMEGRPIEGYVHANWHPADPAAGPYEVA